MIIGNPDTFALIVDVVRHWNNDNHFNNGVLCLCIDGVLMPNYLVNATLNTDLYVLLDYLENVKENVDVFQMDKREAFEHIYKLRFPEDYDLDNDYSYDVSPYSLSDQGYYVFAVKNGEKVRFLGAKLQYVIEEGVHVLEGIDIEETYITVKELHAIVGLLKDYWNDIHTE